MKKTKKPFNWLTRLNQLVRGNVKKPRDYERLSTLAGEWLTCACGQLCAVLPRNQWGTPYDPLLLALGRNFCHQVEVSDWPQALSVFRKIEKRTAKLLKEVA